MGPLTWHRARSGDCGGGEGGGGGGGRASEVERCGQPLKVERRDAAGAKGLLGQFVVVAPLNGDCCVQLEVLYSRKDAGDALLGVASQWQGE